MFMGNYELGMMNYEGSSNILLHHYLIHDNKTFSERTSSLNGMLSIKDDAG